MLKKASRSMKKEKPKKNDLVLVDHAPRSREGYPLPGYPTSLAIVLDTKEETAYIVYTAGRGYKAKAEPFWIDAEYLTLLEEDNASDNSGDENSSEQPRIDSV
jgi:hypothetical protein